ncbi:class I SAM-dependent methyltransferase [Amycolatopsis pigmentata]|uniref:Class I SAM-dependent methyltransferase n=1 Tax=Amycolatopsis pigmentata TaxID=450801 RepID=A0ABW5FYU3_9PSEU
MNDEPMTEVAVAWDAYARTKPQRRATNATGRTSWFNWTQHPDHGPGEDLLGPRPDDRILDLGCGKGGNIAHLATLGVQAIGVDISSVQLDAARTRWGNLTTLRFCRSDALRFLETCIERFDAIYSVFGAVWFLDPALLLPAVYDRLTPGGRFVFSHHPPTKNHYGSRPAFVHREPNRNPLTVRRWDYTASMWRGALERHGFGDARTEVLPGPGPGQRADSGTLLVRARRPPT